MEGEASIVIAPAVLADIGAHAREAVPLECCGLLIGTEERIEHVHRARNVLDSPREYLVDPVDHFGAIRRARSLGLHVIGAYHSHPGGPSRPSARDVAEADPALLYLIACPRDGVADQPAVSAWRLARGNFRPVAIVAVA